MTGAVREYTQYFDFEIPAFDFPGWHTYYDRNIKTVDAILYLITGTDALRGTWKNNEAYNMGDRVIDIDIAGAFECLVSHTSSKVPAMFADDRALYKTYWQDVTDINFTLWSSSITTNTIGTGTKTFATQSGRQFKAGSKVIVTDTSNPTINYMWGAIVSYSGSTIVIDSAVAAGSGSHSSWIISISGERGPVGPQGLMQDAPVGGAVYGRQSGAWTVVAASGSDVLPVTPSGGISSATVQAALYELDQEKVAKLGDVMTGNLTIKHPTDQPALNLQTTTATGTKDIWFYNVAKPEWVLRAANDFVFYRYDDTGTIVSGVSPLSISRSTGDVTHGRDVIATRDVLASGSLRVVNGLIVGGNASSGIYGDGSTLAIRGFGTNNVAIQSAGGSVGYASFGSASSTIYATTLNVNGISAAGGITTAGNLNAANVSVSNGLAVSGPSTLSGVVTLGNALHVDYAGITTASLNTTGQVVAGSNIYTYGYLISQHATNPTCQLNLNNGQALSVFTNEVSIGSTTISNFVSKLTVEYNGVCQIGNGFHGRTGSSGGLSGYIHNFYWDGSNLQAYVDVTHVGNIAFTSDYRIKKDITDLPSTWDTVKAMRPIKYTQAEYTPEIEKTRRAEDVKKALDLKLEIPEHKDVPQPMFAADDVERWGFVAHELQETLIPSAATGVKDQADAVQSLNLPSIIAALTKALQEAMQRIEALEAANAA